VSLLALRYHPARVNRATEARDVIANGQFILTPRSAYEQAGTHAAVKGEVAEDLALAQIFLRRKLKVYFAFAETMMETRMYHGLRHLVEGWSKNVYLGGRASFPDEPARRALVPVVLGAMMLYWMLPPLMLLLGSLGILPSLLPPALAATLLCTLFWMAFSRGMGIPAVYGLTYPLGALLTLYIIGRSTWRGTRKVEWKGRIYRLGEAA
jgi:hypothetical protein